MSRPEADPVGHAAKFVAIFASFPVMFGIIVLALPRMGAPMSSITYALPFVWAVHLARALGLADPEAMAREGRALAHFTSTTMSS